MKKIGAAKKVEDKEEEELVKLINAGQKNHIFALRISMPTEYTVKKLKKKHNN